jgi:hypothetical protein
VCKIAPVGAGLSILALLVVWSWVSRPIWWDPFFRDAQAQQVFRARLRARKVPLAVSGGLLVLFITLAGVNSC